ncbi:MAG: isocitrate lyase/phosphoenolpyruvate mutase family protein [Solirubrobacterales bacterium]|nr:isocitrate lyase/phosphoenolpyruvate mutase family protein [Solirubrobacterales bacterium]
MSGQAEKAERFLARHRPGDPLLLPNAWDAGSAKLLAAVGFEALATTSSGHAATLGQLDGTVTREQALAHAEQIVRATDLPVSADLENCYADDPDGVAETVRGALATGLAGCSIEDFTGELDDPIYPRELAHERVASAVAAAHGGEVQFVITARCENYLRGRTDIEDTLSRLLAYQEAGADVLYAPGVRSSEDIGRLTSALERPLNVLTVPGAPAVAELSELGVARISVGGAFAFNALGALVEAAQELRERGTYGFLERSAGGIRAARDAFG